MRLVPGKINHLKVVFSPKVRTTRRTFGQQIIRTSAMKATWEGQVLAESDSTVVVDNNHYFPPEAIKREFFKESSTHTVCGWKGTASYYDVVVNGKVNKDAAWYYPSTSDRAKKIEGYVAFWKGVQVES
jgi:uncharacterized protein (DUF427 family)